MTARLSLSRLLANAAVSGTFSEINGREIGLYPVQQAAVSHAFGQRKRIIPCSGEGCVD